MFWPPCCRPSSSLSASWSREHTAHSERYSLTARTETAGLIRQLHPSQQREGTQVLDRVQHRTERRSGPHLVQMVEEKIPLNLILNPEEREAALGKIILKKTKSTCLHEAGPQTWPPQRHNIYWFLWVSDVGRGFSKLLHDQDQNEIWNSTSQRWTRPHVILQY